MTEQKSINKAEEICQNPWKHNPKCTSTDIKVYIQSIKKTRKGLETTNLPVCCDCWAKIAKSNKEWGTMTHDQVSKPIMVKGEIDENGLTIMDVMAIGHPKKNATRVPDENDEDVY
jgi:hypothetical protein